METKKTKRDRLDWLDFGIKTVGGAALTVLTFFLHESNDLNKTANALKQQEIDNTMKYGEFTKSLIKDLQARDSSILGSDLTFITLNRTIGDKDSTLIIELGTRIIEDFYKTKKAGDGSDMGTVANIVRERSIAASKKIEHFITDYKSRESDRVTKANNAEILKHLPIAGNSNTKELKATDTLSIAQNIPTKSWNKLTLIPSTATVFIQINKSDINTLTAAKNLQKDLNNRKFNAPGVEVIADFHFPELIRYYYDSDKPAAEKLKTDTKDILNRTIKTQKLDNSKVHPGTIELWVNY